MWWSHVTKYVSFRPVGNTLSDPEQKGSGKGAVCGRQESRSTAATLGRALTNESSRVQISCAFFDPPAIDHLSSSSIRPFQTRHGTPSSRLYNTLMGLGDASFLLLRLQACLSREHRGLAPTCSTRGTTGATSKRNNGGGGPKAHHTICHVTVSVAGRTER